MLTNLLNQAKLYPPIEPYSTHYLDEEGGHKVYFEECGNPHGIPILFIHGGPGGGCNPGHRRYFDPQKWRIILFDQRGCGRSRPLGRLESNTTQALVNDMKKILNRLNIQRAVLFGGSWGSTLALVFTIYFPERVKGMILRGIYLGEDCELDYSSNGLIAQHFPEDWGRFASVLPPEDRKDPLGSYYRMLVSKEIDPSFKANLIREWTRYEDGHSFLKPPNWENLEKELDKYDPKEMEACAILETHYFMNSCFLPPNDILEHLPLIPNVPISIVHGRYDIICPPRSAYKLEQGLKLENQTQLRTFFTLAGHALADPENRKRVIFETNLIHEKIKPR